MLLVQDLLDRSNTLFKEANATTGKYFWWLSDQQAIPIHDADRMKAAELRTEAIHIRKKAHRKAKKMLNFAEEIQKQSEDKVIELREKSMTSSSVST